jgi:phosphoribosylglycinamide formyltransferase 1
MLLKTQTLLPIYKPIEKRPMNIVAFGSGFGTNIEALLRAQKNSKTYPSFEIKALFTDRECRVHDIGASAGIPVAHHSFTEFFQKAGMSFKRDSDTRAKYDVENVRIILEYADKYNFTVDLIFLAGYMRLLYPPLLQAFENKIINVHPADLTEVTSKGKRRYIGVRGVYDALCDAKNQTRSSVFLVDENIDAGPILVSGPWVPYEGEYPITKERAEEHQNKQKAVSDWPASFTAITMIAQGRIALDDRKNVYVDGVMQQADGYNMSK